jgi:hypothetical protein
LGIELRGLYLPRQYKDMNEALKRGMPREELSARIATLIVPEAPTKQEEERRIGELCDRVLEGARNLPPEVSAAWSEAAGDEGPGATAGEKSGEAVPPPAPAPEVSVDAAPPGAPVVERREDGIHFVFRQRSYRVGGLPGKRREHLRVSLKVESAGAVHMDHLDLYSARGRAAYVACCRRIFEAQEGELHGELNRIMGELEKFQISRARAGKKRTRVPRP